MAIDWELRTRLIAQSLDEHNHNTGWAGRPKDLGHAKRFCPVCADLRNLTRFEKTRTGARN